MPPLASPTPPAIASISSATLIDDEVEDRFEPDEGLPRGQVVGRYVILERVGAGGMGVVYAAYDRDLDRRVAIKLLHARSRPALSKGSARLLREAQAMARLAHPNVVMVHEVGTYREHPFVAMEFVDGQTFGHWLGASSRRWREVVAMSMQAGRGLAAAHAQGLVHRDFKPENVLVGHDGRARVVDFGLARATSETSQEDLPIDEGFSGSSSVSQRLTETGALAGTPAYMAPEQFRGQAPDARSDQFAFCVTLWEALYGERPFHGDNRAQLAMAVCNGELRDPPARDVPAFLRRALRRGLALEPEDRFPSMEELLAALDRDPVRSRRRMLAAGAAAVVIATSSALAARLSGGSEPEDPCAGTEQRLAGAWDDGREQALAQAFARVDAEFAAASLDTVTAELDGYAQRWTRSYRDACEATHLRHEQSTALLDRRMACLERRREALAATTELLAEADRDGIARSVQAVNALPSVDACNDAERMIARFAPPDPEVAERVEELRTRLAHASALGLTGRADEGLVEALAAESEAVELGYAPLDAEVALVVADLSVSAGQPLESRRWLHEAVDEAIASGHDEVLVDAASRLVSIEGVSLSHYDDAERWGRLAAAAVRRRGRDMGDTIALARRMCMMLADKGDPTAALPHCQEALELSLARHGPEHALTGLAHRALGNALYIAADYDAAGRAYERATELFLRSHGVDHPEYPALLNSLAAVCHSQERGEECLGLFEDTVEAAIASYGPEHPAVADFTNNLAIVLVAEGRLDEAEARAQRSLEIRRSKFGDDHPGVAAAHRVLARVAQARGDLLLARDHADRAVTIVRATRGEDHPDTIEALAIRGRIRLASGDVAGGLRDYEDALAVVERLDRPPRERAPLRFSLAQALAEHRPAERERARALAAAAQGEAGDDPLAEEIARWRAETDDDSAPAPEPDPR